MADDAKHWSNLHERMVQGKVEYNPGFYVIDTSQEGHGDVTLVTPTQAQVDQAKVQIKRKLSPTIGVITKRRKKTPKKTQKGGKSKAKKGQKGGKRQRGGSKKGQRGGSKKGQGKRKGGAAKRRKAKKPTKKR